MLPDPLARSFGPSHPATGAGTGIASIGTTMIPRESTIVASTLPSLPVLSTFMLSHFAQLSPMAAAAEVPWIYHSPLPPRPIPKQTQQQAAAGAPLQIPPPRPLPANSSVKKLVLSITPTEGVYTVLGASPLPPPHNHPSINGTSRSATAKDFVQNTFRSPTTNREKYTTAAFLHRPWRLTRGRLPRGTTVWSSHKAFDESLTTGYNLALLQKLGAYVQGARVLVGYKGDEGRRIGVVAGFGGDGKQGLEREELKGRIVAEFGDLTGEGEWFGFDGAAVNGMTTDGGDAGNEGLRDDVKITSIACMNAFHPEEVDRVASAAFEAGFVASIEDCCGLVYLTGAVREEGLQAALQKGMKVVCVGHRLCEVWGIGYLAQRVKERWPDIEVQVVDEKEEVPPPKGKVVKAVSQRHKQKSKKKEQSEIVETERTEVAKKRRTSDENHDEEGGVLL